MTPANPKALQALLNELAEKAAATTGYVIISSDRTSRDGYDHYCAIDTALHVVPEARPYRYGPTKRYTYQG